MKTKTSNFTIFESCTLQLQKDGTWFWWIATAYIIQSTKRCWTFHQDIFCTRRNSIWENKELHWKNQTFKLNFSVSVNYLPVWNLAFISSVAKPPIFHIQKLWHGMISAAVFHSEVLYFKTRCHTIYYCHSDWLEDNISSSVVLWHILCDLITSCLAPEAAGREPSWGLATASGLLLRGYDGISWYC